MTVMRAHFQRTLFPVISEFLWRGYNEVPTQYPMIFREETSASAFEEDFSAAGAGLFVRTAENEEFAEDRFVRGFRKRYTHIDYSLAIGFSHRMIKDSKQPSLWRDRPADIGFSGRQTKEILHADYFNTAFSANNGPDGVPLFSAVHPNPKGGTQSNIWVGNPSVSVAGLREGLQQFRKFNDDTGVRRIQLEPEDWVVPVDQEYNAKEIVQSAGRPDTANRADNVIKGAVTVRVWVYLTSSKNHFLLCRKAQRKIKAYSREKLSITEYEEERRRINWVAAWMTFSFGHSHWIGTLGSQPA